MSDLNTNLFELVKMINPEQPGPLKELIMKNFSQTHNAEAKETGMEQADNTDGDEFIEFLAQRLRVNERSCPFCSNKYVIKYGRNARKQQRFMCKECGRTFCNLTKTPFSYSKKSSYMWLEFIECMCRRYTIRQCAQLLEVNIATAFQWRHKILNSILFSLPENLKGIIEIDEVLITESYKGNHSKDDSFFMPRKPIRHQQSPQEQIYSSKVSILCCKDRSDIIFARVSNRHRATPQKIYKLLNNRIPEGATICTNRNIGYKWLAKKLKLKLHTMKRFNEVKDEIYHIQNARALGRSLKIFIYNFKGVATKYLNHYIIWFRWLQNVEQFIEKMKADLLILSVFSHRKLRVCDLKAVSSFQ